MGGLVVFLAISVAAADPPPLPPGLEVGHIQTTSWSREEVPLERGPRIEAALRATQSPPPTESPATVAPTDVPAPDLTQNDPAPPISEPPATVPPALDSPTPTLPPMVSGPRVFALGDSVMLGAAPALASTIENLEIDAAVSRQVSEGIGILQWRRDHGLLGDVVIIHLGNNGNFRGSDLEEMMSILSDVKRVIFVTVKVPLDWEEPNNGVIASAAAYPNVVVADWHTLGSEHPDIFGDDGTHVGPTGAAYYAQLVTPYVAV
jgi:hypothetical protein